jgi:hypothetical protein
LHLDSDRFRLTAVFKRRNLLDGSASVRHINVR